MWWAWNYYRCLIWYTPWLNGGIQLLVILLIMLENITYYNLLSKSLFITVTVYILWTGRKYSIYILVVWNWNHCLLQSTPRFIFNVYISSGSNGISFLIWKRENWWKVGIWYFLMKGVFINSHTEIYVLNSKENTKLHSQH